MWVRVPPELLMEVNKRISMTGNEAQNLLWFIENSRYVNGSANPGMAFSHEEMRKKYVEELKTLIMVFDL